MAGLQTVNLKLSASTAIASVRNVKYRHMCVHDQIADPPKQLLSNRVCYMAL